MNYDKKMNMAMDILSKIEGNVSKISYDDITSKLMRIVQPTNNFETYCSDLTELVNSIASGKSGTIVSYPIEAAVKQIMKKIYPNDADIDLCDINSATRLMRWLSSSPEIIYLDRTDKNYLANIIRPYIKLGYDVMIKKMLGSTGEYTIAIWVTCENGHVHPIYLPPFKDKSMYGGLEIDRLYTPKELGII